MRWLVFLVLLGLIGGSFAVEKCVACEQLSGQPAPRLNSFIEGSTLHVQAFYDNISLNSSRQPLSNTILIVEVSSPSKVLDVYRIYTDQNGSATLDFSSMNKTCLSFKILYCPFCNPNAPTCGFDSCLKYSRIQTNASSAAEITVGPGTTVLSDNQLNPNLYQPNIISTSFCPPPPPLTSTPAICLPVMLIFALLGGALYLSGHNPLAAFNMGSPRIGKHLRSTPRGRSVSANLMSVVQAASSIASAAKTIGEKGVGGLAKAELDQAKARMNAMDIGKTVKSGLHELKRSKAAKTKSASASSKSATTATVATAQGTSFVMGTSGPGFASLVKGRTLGEMIKQDGIFKVLGAFALDVFQNTIPGRTIGFLYQLSTGRSLFETAFMKPMMRITELAMANAELVSKDGKPTILIGDKKYSLVGKTGVDGQPTFIVTDDKGNKTMTINVEGADGKSSPISITIDKAGQISQIKLQIENLGTVFMTKENGQITVFRLPEQKDASEKPEPIQIITDAKELATIQAALGKMPVNFNTDGKKLFENAELRMETISLNQYQMKEEAKREAKILSQTALSHMSGDSKETFATLYEKESEDTLRRMGIDPGKVPKDGQLVSALNEALSGSGGIGSDGFTVHLLAASGVKDAESEKPSQKTRAATVALNEVVNGLTVTELATITPEKLREKLGARVDGVSIDFNAVAASLHDQGKRFQSSFAGQEQSVQTALNAATVGSLNPVREAAFAKEHPLELMRRHQQDVPQEQLTSVSGYLLANKLLDMAMNQAYAGDNDQRAGQMLTRVSEIFALLESSKVGAVKKERLDEALSATAAYVASQELTPVTRTITPYQMFIASQTANAEYRQTVDLAQSALAANSGESYETAASAATRLSKKSEETALSTAAGNMATLSVALHSAQQSLTLLGGTVPNIDLNTALTNIGDKALSDLVAKGDSASLAAAHKRLEILASDSQDARKALYLLDRNILKNTLEPLATKTAAEQYGYNTATVYAYGAVLGDLTSFDPKKIDADLNAKKAERERLKTELSAEERKAPTTEDFLKPDSFAKEQKLKSDLATLDQQIGELSGRKQHIYNEAQKLREEFETMGRYNIEGASEVAAYLRNCQDAILRGQNVSEVEQPPGSFNKFAEQQATLRTTFEREANTGFSDLDARLEADKKSAEQLKKESDAEQKSLEARRASKDEKPQKPTGPDTKGA